MIGRKVLLVDRVATVLLALALIAGGCLGVWWWSGQSPMPDRTSVAHARSALDSQWWPWAGFVVGVVLILLGIRWIAAHLSRRKVASLDLPGSGPAGRFDVAASKAAAAAATVLSDVVGVRSVRGTIDRDRGQLVAHLVATIEPDADLEVVAQQADLVSAQLAAVLGRADLRSSTELKVARRGRALPRVS